MGLQRIKEWVAIEFVVAFNADLQGAVAYSARNAERCAALAAVVGEVWGDAPALDFTATKRLALRAEAQGVPGWLLRRAASPDLSAARARWRLSSAPSESDAYDPRAPGAPRWQAELFRARWQVPGTWVVRHDAEGKMRFEEAAPAQIDTPEVAQPATAALA